MIFILFITIGSISASENVSEDFTLEDSLADETVNIAESENNALDESFSDDIVSYSDDNNNLTLNAKNEVLSSSNGNVVRVYESTQAEYSPSVQQYSSGNIVYKVKLFDIVSYDGVKYNEPKYGHTVKLRVYTGSSFKDCYGTVGNDGKASINIKNLAIGTHKVDIFYANNKMGSSYIKVIKSKTIVYAPVKTIKHKKNTYYKIKVLDSHKNPVKNVILKVKVFTGKKSKTYSIKTNSKGVAKLKTRGLGLGIHKITITTKNKKYKISKNTKISIRSKVPKKAEKLSVSAPAGTVRYLQNHYYDITVKDSYADPVKKLALKVKVFTGKKSKTYSIKTNANGVAKLQTNKLSLGTHKISITTKNKNYKISKSSKIIVKRQLTPKAGAPTPLKSLDYYPQGNDYYAKLTWVSKAGTSYQVLKKTAGDYNVVSTVKADSNEASYFDKVAQGEKATYSVRELIMNNNGNLIGPHDDAGLTLIDSPNVKADFQNLKAIVTWDKIAEANQYMILRKMGRDGTYKCIAVVDAKQTSYVDWYYKSPELNTENFIDPSNIDLFYTVRACNIQEVNDFQKASYGLYLKDGDFHLEAPAIIYLKNNTITWGTVPTAQGYLILKKYENETNWHEIAKLDRNEYITASLYIGEIDKDAYYAVQAYATKNEKTVYSNYDKGFTLKNYDENNSDYRILYFGDSITYGTPYHNPLTMHIFSMPHRIAQLTGCAFYNPSIPGSTYRDLGVKPDGTNVEKTSFYRYRISREVVDAISVGNLPGNWEFLDSDKNSEGQRNTRISDYNVVVLAAGTNDYLDDSVLGSVDSYDTSTFYGALNHIMAKIKEASDTRVSMNLTPIKVVFVDLFYSDRTNHYKTLHNRDITPNNLGLTLMDYQRAIDDIYNRWSASDLELFNFKTRDYGIVTNENCPYTSSDNLHFSKFTYGQYGNAIAEFLVENVFN